MRICYPFVGDTIGGAQLSTLTLVRHLPEEFEPVLVLFQDGPFAELLRSQDIAFKILSVGKVAGRRGNPASQLNAMAKIVWPLRKFLRAQHIDIVHTQDGRNHISWYLPARLSRTAMIWHQRSPYSASRLSDHIVSRAARVVAISKTAAAGIPVKVGRKPIIIHNPVESVEPSLTREQARVNILKAAQDANIETGEDCVVVASVGNLRAVKQPLLLARSISAFAGEVARPVLLVILGEDRGDWIPRMREILSSTDLNTHLVHVGFVQQVADWLSGCDMLFATSNGDAFGRTLVEALGLGVPVAAIRAGGHGEIISHNEDGVLISDGDPDLFGKEAADLFLDSGLRAKVIKAGHERALVFHPRHHVEKITKLYRELESGLFDA